MAGRRKGMLCPAKSTGGYGVNILMCLEGAPRNSSGNCGFCPRGAQYSTSCPFRSRELIAITGLMIRKDSMPVKGGVVHDCDPRGYLPGFGRP